MSRIHLWTLDLNLLVVLDVLLQERSVTRAARRLGRTQSAVSHALNRLRALLGDELLVRDGHQMRPTGRALALAESLPRALEMVGQALSEAEPFRPERSARTFRLAAPDFIGAALPDLLAELAAEAPLARVELVAAGPGAARDVAEGRVDGLIAPPRADDALLRSEALGSSAWRVYGRQDHPAFHPWSPEAWGRWPHLRIRTAGAEPGPVDRAAAAAGLERVIGATIPHFAMAPAILARTDLLLTVPEVALSGDARGLADRPPPFPLAPMPLALHRSALTAHDAGGRWFLGLLGRVMRRLLGAEPPADHAAQSGGG